MPGLDTGPVCLGSDVPIPSAMTAGQLHDVLSKLGAELMVEALARLEAGQLEAVPQPSDGVTYASKIDKRETRIDFAKPAQEVANHIRGLSPNPGAWFETDGAGKRERIRDSRGVTGSRRRCRGISTRRQSDDCLRPRRHSRAAVAACRQATDGGLGFSTRNTPCAGHAL